MIIRAIFHDDPRGLRSFHVTGTGDDLGYEIDHGREMDDGGHRYIARETIVELVHRMIKSRWSRWDAYAMTIRPATSIDMDYLPSLHASCVTPCYCGPGWFDLLNAVFGWIEEMDEVEWQTGQVKEKFGRLRVYYDGYPGEDGDQIIEAAEIVSGHVCEECGVPGQVRPGGWIKTLCDPCARRTGK